MGPPDNRCPGRTAPGDGAVCGQRNCRLVHYYGLGSHRHPFDGRFDGTLARRGDIVAEKLAGHTESPANGFRIGHGHDTVMS
jgi:hypothetical protein